MECTCRSPEIPHARAGKDCIRRPPPYPITHRVRPPSFQEPTPVALHSIVTRRSNLRLVERELLNNWLASYGRAWTGRNPEAAASLYAENATYQVTPFDEPIRGRAAIYEYWVGVAKTEEKIQFDFEVLAVTSEHGIARWQASFVRVPPGLETKLDGIFLIRLDSSGRCKSLREWWHKRQ